MATKTVVRKSQLKRQICRLWLNNSCANPQCRLSHDPKDNIDCKFWVKDKCKFGVRCKYNHDINMLPDKKIAELSKFILPDRQTDKDVGLVIFRYYIDVFLHSIGINITLDVINIIAQYCTVLHYSMARRLTDNYLCQKCMKFNDSFTCEGCYSSINRLRLIYMDNEANPIILCYDDKCMTRLGISLSKNIGKISTEILEHKPYRVKNVQCCAGVPSLADDLTMETCRIDKIIKREKEIDDRRKFTEELLNLKPFNGIVLDANSIDLRCYCGHAYSDSEEESDSDYQGYSDEDDSEEEYSDG